MAGLTASRSRHVVASPAWALCGAATEQMLRDDEVHVWIASLGEGGADADVELLGEAERVRAARLRSADDRRRYVGAHCLFRRLLAGYLGERPEALRFRHGGRGKPELVREIGQPTLSFNLSHAPGWAAVAVARSWPVGVDIEEIDASLDLDSVAAIGLSDAERKALAGVSQADRHRCFYSAWTCKEAVLKAVGSGLGDGLAEVAVPINALVADASHGCDFVTGVGPRWRVRGLAPADNCVGAVAAPAGEWMLRCFLAAASTQETGLV